MKHLQEDHAQWLQREYPGQPPEIPVAGMVEEAGELLHCALKLEQMRLWGADSRYSEEKLFAYAMDSIGDCGIYACSMCNVMGWDFAQLWDHATHYDHSESDFFRICMRLVNVASSNVAPYTRIHLVQFLYTLQCAAKRIDVDAGNAVWDTWKVVRTRKRAEPAQQRPTVVCLCGSTRFGDAYKEANKRETLAGRIVLSVGLLGHQEGLDMQSETKRMLDALHLRKVEMADEVLILNVGGYIGESTNREYEHARRLGKRIRFWTQENSDGPAGLAGHGGPGAPS